MDLSKILSISGKPGLFELVSTSKNGLVVLSLVDGKKFTAFNHFNISSLEEINVYTDSGEVSLKVILKKMAKSRDFKEALSHKSSAKELEAFFEEVIPDYDKENVYTSDIKKIIQWYNLLAKKEMLVFEEEVEESSDIEAVDDKKEVEQSDKKVEKNNDK